VECIESFKTKQNARIGRTANTHLEIVAIQETRLGGNGLIKRNNYSPWI